MATGKCVLIVPGAWHGPEAYSKVAEFLKEAGYTTASVSLPSVGPSVHLTDFGPDVAAVRQQIQGLADSGQEIIVFCHSYGSIPASEAVQGFELARREQQGKTGGVVHIFMCTAFIIPEGKSIFSAFGGQTPPWHIVSEDEMEYNAANPEKIFYNDLPDAEANAAVSVLRPSSYQTVKTPTTYAAWKYIPTTFLYCLKDNAVPVQYQKMMVEETGKGYDIRTETVDSSHSPFLSRPNDVAVAIRRAAGEKL